MQVALRAGIFRSHYGRQGSQMVIVDGETAGWLLVEERPGSIHLVEISVLGKYRRQGIGTACIHETIAAAERAAGERRGLAPPSDRPEEASGEPETNGAAPAEAPRSGPALRHETQLLEVLLANPLLVARAKGEVKPEDMEHPGLRRLLECLYRLETEGRQADLDHLQERLDNERLMETARRLQERGLEYLDGALELTGVLQRFLGRQIAPLKQALRARLEAGDMQGAAELQQQLRELSKRMTKNPMDSQ